MKDEKTPEKKPKTPNYSPAAMIAQKRRRQWVEQNFRNYEGLMNTEKKIEEETEE